MKRKNLLKKCRFFDGVNVTSMCAEAERFWVEHMPKNDPIIQSMISEYKERIGDAYVEDDTPETLQAVLFNRFYQWQGPYCTNKDFVKWYNDEYIKAGKVS